MVQYYSRTIYSRVDHYMRIKGGNNGPLIFRSLIRRLLTWTPIKSGRLDYRPARDFELAFKKGSSQCSWLRDLTKDILRFSSPFWGTFIVCVTFSLSRWTPVGCTHGSTRSMYAVFTNYIANHSAEKFGTPMLRYALCRPEMFVKFTDCF